MCYDGGMRPYAVAVLMMLIAGPAFAADTLAEARRLYNLGQYETAEKLALEAASNPARADAARVVLGRIRLERFRQSADPKDLTTARESLRMVDTAPLDTAERVELTIGLAEALYFEEHYGAAAQLFESVRQRSALLGRLRTNACSTGGRRRWTSTRSRGRRRNARRSTGVSSSE